MDINTKRLKEIKERLNTRSVSEAMDGGPGSGNWGHEGVKGQLGGSAKGGGAQNREYREKKGYISTMRKNDKQLVEKTVQKAEEAKQNLAKLTKINHDAYVRCKEAAEKGEKIPSATEANKDNVLRHSSKEAQDAYNKALQNEQRITKDMISIASKNGTEMYGLDFSAKTASSVEGKIDRRMAEITAEEKKSKTDADIVREMNDLVRYTQLCDHDKMAESTKETISSMKEQGYHIKWIDNKWMNEKASYKGLHIVAESPEGQSFELQIHSKESMAIKEQNHLMYEEERKYKQTAYVIDELDKRMKENTDSMRFPKGMDDPALKSWEEELR